MKTVELMSMLSGDRGALESEARRIFSRAPDEYRMLIRYILTDERDVMHLKRRSDIHQRIYEHVRRVVK